MSVEQLRKEVALHNLDTSRIKATRIQVLSETGHRVHKLRVTHDTPACDLTDYLRARGLELQHDCSSLAVAEHYMLKLAFHVQPQERLLVRQALQVLGMNVHAMKTTPLTSDELERYRELISYRKKAHRLMAELNEAKRIKAEKEKMSQAEAELRSRYTVVDQEEPERPSAQQLAENQRAAARRTARIKQPVAGAVPMTAAQQELTHE